MKYRGKCSGMEDHFDTSGVFERSKFDISKFACTWLTDFFFKILRSRGGKKIKIKSTKFFYLFNLKHIGIGGKEITKTV